MRTFKTFTLTVLLAGAAAFAASAEETRIKPFEKDGFYFASYYNDPGNLALINPSTGGWDQYFPDVVSDPQYEGDVTLPSEVEWEGRTYKVVAIYDNFMRNCPGLTSVTIPSSVYSVGSWLSGCPSLRYIHVAEGNETYYSVDGVLFQNSDKWGKILLSYPEAHGDVYAIPEDTDAIWAGVFQNNTSLRSVTIPESLTFISSWTFSGCTSLTEVKLPSALKVLGSNAFCGVPLQSIELPEGLETLGYCALADTPIRKLHIPASLIDLGAGANDNNFRYNPLYAMPALATVTADSGNPVVKVEDNILYSKDGKEVLGFPTGSVKSEGESLVLPEGVQVICDDAFYSAPLAYIEFPSTLKRIDGYAFSMSKLRELDMPDSVEKLGLSCFARNRELKRVRLSQKLTSLPDEAFVWCTALEEIEVPESVRSIGSDCFGDCHALMKIRLPEQMESIGRYALCCLWNVDDIRIPYGITDLEGYVLWGCGTYAPGLFTVHLPATLKHVSSSAILDSGLGHLMVEADEPPVCEADAFGSAEYQATLHVPVGRAEAYAQAPVWRDFKTIVDDQVASQGAIAMDGSIACSKSGDSVEFSLPGAADWALYASDGRVVASANGVERFAPVSGLPSGIYLVTAKTRTGAVLTLKVTL